MSPSPLDLAARPQGGVRAEPAGDAERPARIYNPFLPEFRRDPFPIYHAVREQGPIHRFSTFGGSQWLFTRYRHVRDYLGDTRFLVDDLPELVSRKSPAAAESAKVLTLADCIARWLFFTDREIHHVARRAFGRMFTPGGVAQWRGQIEQNVRELLRPLRGCREFDLIAQIAAPLPAMTTLQMFGLPAGREAELRSWATDMFRALFPPQSLETYAQMGEVVREFSAYLRPLIDAARRGEGTGMLAELVRATADKGLDERTVDALVLMVISAGQDTVAGVLGNGMRALLLHPEQRALVWRDPECIPGAVDEMLRYDTPVMGVARRAGEDMIIDGVALARGDRVNFAIAAANRDPEMFENPDAFELRRTVRSKITFGVGAHFCLGAHLARLQVEVAVRALAEEFPALQLTDASPQWRPTVLLRLLTALPVRVAAPAP